MAGDRRPLLGWERTIIYEAWKRGLPREQAVREIGARLGKEGSPRSLDVIRRHLDVLDFLERNGIRALLSRERWDNEVKPELDKLHPGLRLGLRAVNDCIRFIQARTANPV